MGIDIAGLQARLGNHEENCMQIARGLLEDEGADVSSLSIAEAVGDYMEENNLKDEEGSDDEGLTDQLTNLIDFYISGAVITYVFPGEGDR